MAVLRADSYKGRPWAWGWAYQFVKGSKFATLGAGPVAVGSLSSKSHHLLPASFYLACRRPCSSQSVPPVTPSSPFNIHAVDFNLRPFDFVPCAKDDKGVLSSVDFALAVPYRREEEKIRCLSVERSSAIRFGFSIYSIIFDVIDEQRRVSRLQAQVIHDPVQKMKKVIDSHEIPHTSARARHLDSLEDSQGISGSCTQQKLDNDMDFPSTGACDVIVPVDSEDDEQIYYCAECALESHNMYLEKEAEISLEKVLSASKSDLGDGIRYFMILRAVDGNNISNTYYAIVNVKGGREIYPDTVFLSEPLQKYQIGLVA